MMGKYLIITYGCQMNVHESEKIAGMLVGLGYQKTDNIKDASIIVFNTCTIRENAVKRLMGNIGSLKALKSANKNLIICITGCATQDKADAEIIYKRFPFVDIILGTHNIHLLGDYINQRKLGKRLLNVFEKETDEFYQLPMVRNNSFSANINIMYGCNNFCSYCIVPYVRGRERSRPCEDIILEAEQLIKSGVKEIMLLGQNVNSYGKGGDVSFAQLLLRVAGIEGKFRVKFMTSHPKDFSDELLEVIATNPKISKHIHLPVQSGSNKILADMNRVYTREDYLRLVDRIKSRIPNVNLTSDIIVGFPSEDEAEFLDTLDLVKRVEYSAIYAFVYSKRRGTKASEMPDPVAYEVKNQRLIQLLAEQREISTRLAQQKLGMECEVLCLTGDDNKLIALTLFDEVVNLQDYTEGEFAQVRVTNVRGARLFGEKI